MQSIEAVVTVEFFFVFEEFSSVLTYVAYANRVNTIFTKIKNVCLIKTLVPKTSSQAIWLTIEEARNLSQLYFLPANMNAPVAEEITEGLGRIEAGVHMVDWDIADHPLQS